MICIFYPDFQVFTNRIFKYQHWFDIISGIYKLLVKGAIPLNDSSITNKEIARLLEQHDLLASSAKPRKDFQPVKLPRGETLARYIGEAIARHGTHVGTAESKWAVDWLDGCL